MSELLTALTECGGLTPVAAMAIFVTLVLAMTSPPATTRRWVLSVMAAGAGIALAKGIFIPCGAYLPGLDLRSPSGHVAGSVAIYGGLAALFWTSRPGTLRVLIALVVTATCIGIAVSRVYLHAHSVSEVIVGGLVGLIVPVSMLRAPKPHPDLVRPIALSAVAAIPVALIAIHVPDVRTSSEPFIQAGSRWLADRSGICPVPLRADGHPALPLLMPRSA